MEFGLIESPNRWKGNHKPNMNINLLQIKKKTYNGKNVHGK